MKKLKIFTFMGVRIFAGFKKPLSFSERGWGDRRYGEVIAVKTAFIRTPTFIFLISLLSSSCEKLLIQKDKNFPYENAQFSQIGRAHV